MSSAKVVANDTGPPISRQVKLTHLKKWFSCIDLFQELPYPWVMDELFRIALDTKRRHAYNFQKGKWIRGFTHSGDVESDIRWSKWKRLQQAIREPTPNMTYQDLINRVMKDSDE